MAVFVLSEEEITELACQFSVACDGHNAAVILVAMSDMLVALAAAHPDLTPAGILSEFISLMNQRHGIGGAGHTLN